MNDNSKKSYTKKNKEIKSFFSYIQQSVRNKTYDLRREITEMMFPTIKVLFWSLIKVILVGAACCFMVLYFDIGVLFILKNVFNYTSIQ